MSGSNLHDPRLSGHFTVLLYPFIHTLGEGKTRRDRFAALEPRWQWWWNRVGIHSDNGRVDTRQFLNQLHRGDYFLPQARAQLFPEISLLEEQCSWSGVAERRERIVALCHKRLAELDNEFRSDGVMHLTACPALREYLSRFTVLRFDDRSDRVLPGIEVELEWADLHLFHAQWGFLAVKVRLREANPTLSRHMEMNRALMSLRQPSQGDRSLRLEMQDGSQCSMAEWVSFLLQGLVEENPPTTLSPGGPVRLTGDPLYTDSRNGRAYGDRWLSLSYACLTQPIAPGVKAGVFASAADRYLYEFATGLRLDQSLSDPDWMPSSEQAKSLMRRHRVHDWNCWRGLMLKDGCYFLGTESNRFNSRTLPNNITQFYLPLYLYTLHQHFSLQRFASALTLKVARDDLHLAEARELQRSFNAFRLRYWFNVVTARPQGNRLYQMMQRGLEVPKTFTLVARSLRWSRDYYERLWERDVGKMRLVTGLCTSLLIGGAGGGASMWLVQNHWFKTLALLGALLLLLLLWSLWPAHSPIKVLVKRVAGWLWNWIPSSSRSRAQAAVAGSSDAITPRRAA